MRRFVPSGLQCAVVLALGLATAPLAHAATLTCGTGSGLAGQTVDITLTSSDLTGLAVRSLQFDLSYNANLITAVDVLEAGTSVSTAGWGDATFNVTQNGAAGKISISHAGTTALTGAGALVKVRFVINPAQLTANSSTLTLANVLFNEGTPPITGTTNGSLTINATPIITVSPASGEIIRGQTLAFTVSGSVSAPVTWSTTNVAVATISGAGVLTGVAPGAVRVVAVDNAGVRDTTNGDILVRGMGLSVVASSVFLGNTVDVPITVTALDGLGISAGQFTLSFDPTRVSAVGVQTPVGTLLSGYGSVGFGSSPNTCTVDFAGSSALTGSGTLCYVRLLASGPSVGATAVTPTLGLFNELYPAKLTAANVTVNTLPVITIAPDQVTLLAGQTQQFTVSGSTTPPLAWSVLDPTIASISATGLLTAIKGGVTQVRVQDAIGALDLNTSVTVHDLKVTVATVNVPPGGTIQVPLNADRSLTGKQIKSMQYRVSWTSPYITQVTSLPIGAVYLWGAGNIVSTVASTSITVAAAGTGSLDFADPAVHVLQFTISPGAPAGTNIALTVTGFLFNEGKPSVLTANGIIQVRNPTSVGDDAALSFTLGDAVPSPMRASTHIRFTLPRSSDQASPVRLAVFGLDGRRVRSLWDTPAAAGAHDVVWDGRDAVGHPVAPGVYFYRLDWSGQTRSRKLAVVR